MEYTEYITIKLDNGLKVVPLQQAEAIRRERDALFIANKNLTTILQMYERCVHVDPVTE